MSALDKFTEKIEKQIEHIRKNPYDCAREMLAPHENDPNEAIFWFPETVKTGFRVPKTAFVRLPVEVWYDAWALALDGKTEGPAWDNVIKAIKEAVPGFNPSEGFFFRTGGSSGKFTFNDSCRISDEKSLVKAITYTWYENELCGKPLSRWLMFREFIETDNNRPAIYCGLKLNTEVRIFWDADEKKVLGAFDYWYQESDRIKHVLEYQPEELSAYTEAESEVRDEVARLTPALIDECRKRLPAMELEGQWSVDFMWTGSEWVLIDMAVARQSAFFECIENR